MHIVFKQTFGLVALSIETCAAVACHRLAGAQLGLWLDQEFRSKMKHSLLRATASKYRKSADSEENSDFLLLRQKDPFGELFSEIYFQSSREFTFL